MAGRLLKCYGYKCLENGTKWPKEELFNKGNKNFCRECYEQTVKDENGRKTLYSVITQVYNIPFPNGMMLRQIKEFKRIRSYEYEDIAKALLYAKHILNRDMQVKYGLGLIPYIIGDAIKYYQDQKDRVENMKGKNVLTDNKVLKKQFNEYEKDEKRNEKIINMEDILK